MSKIKLTGDTSGYIEISAPNVAANNTLELGGGTKILTNLDNVFTGVTTYSGNIDLNANLDLDDNNKILLGTGDDLQIYHDGSNSYIDDTGTGRLNIRGNTGVSLRNYSDSEQFINCYTNGTVELFHDNTKKFETTNTGAVVTGILTATTFSGNLTGNVTGNVTGDLTGNLAGTASIAGISSSISDTAVDIFVYDTRKDSDGGAWRKRTQHTSWYNETLGTATRGSRKEFPAVAVIVVTAATTRKLYIYDGDDPDLPMWMVIDTIDGQWPQVESSSLHALNGIIALGSSSDSQPLYETRNRLDLYYFVSDKIESSGAGTGGSYYGTVDGLVNRRSHAANLGSTAGNSVYPLVNIRVNDVAMTVLPNAPVDSATGLPVPTIAVATNAGISVITDSGSVYDLTTGDVYDHYSKVEFGANNRLYYTAYDTQVLYSRAIPSADHNYTAYNSQNTNRVMFPTMDHGGFTSGHPVRLLGTNGGTNPLLIVKNKASGSNETSYAPSGFGIRPGLTFIDEGETNPTSMVAYATTSYNTGWMQGDIKGAFLSDTDTTNITGSNLIDNGDFGTGDFTNWSTSGSTTPTISSGGALLTVGAADGAIWQSTSGEATSGKWNISWDVTSNSGGFFGLYINNNGANGSGGSLVKDSITTSGSYYYEGNITAVEFRHRGSSSGIIDNIALVRVGDEDRSVNNKGLQVFGTITKSAVATGAELVSYSGWSSSNYLRQPYNSDLDFGTGDWSYMFWYNPNDAESGDVIFSRWSYNVDSNQAPRVSVYFNSGNLRVDTADASAGSGYQGHFGSDGTQDSNEWHCAVILRRGSNLEIWIDGKNYKIAALNSNSDGSYTDANSILEIGHSPGTGSTEAGLELALFRISGSAPSPEQIKKIYEDEKVLFQENAKATLYGSSDAVTALGYDEDTELLHVGTSAGRSDFQGLRRINNTTTAVTTAISASDDLIAEQ